MPTPNRPVRRGQVWWTVWEPHRGSEQGGRRPSVIVQSNLGNEVDAYELTIVLAMTSSPQEADALTIAIDPSPLNGLSKPGFVLCEQILTIAKGRLDGYIGQLEPRYLAKIDDGLLRALGLPSQSGS